MLGCPGALPFIRYSVPSETVSGLHGRVAFQPYVRIEDIYISPWVFIPMVSWRIGDDLAIFWGRVSLIRYCMGGVHGFLFFFGVIVISSNISLLCSLSIGAFGVSLERGRYTNGRSLFTCFVHIACSQHFHCAQVQSTWRPEKPNISCHLLDNRNNSRESFGARDSPYVVIPRFFSCGTGSIVTRQASLVSSEPFRNS